METKTVNTKQPSIKRPAFDMYIKNGISYCIYHEDLIVDAVTAEQMTEARLLLQETNVYPVLVDARQGIYITNSARTFMASSEANRQVSAMAFLINHHVMNILFTTMLRLKICKMPVKIFTDEQAALQWLESFKEVKKGNIRKRTSLLLF